MFPKYIVLATGEVIPFDAEEVLSKAVEAIELVGTLEKERAEMLEVLWQIETATDRWGEVGKVLARVARSTYAESQD